MSWDFGNVTENDLRKIRRANYSRLDKVPKYPPIDPPKGKRWVFDPDMSDEFDDDCVDRRKWEINNKNWNGRQPGWFKDENVSVFQGKGTNSLYLRTQEEKHTPANLRKYGYENFSTAFVRTNKVRKYGYFEIVCRLMDSRVSSAFWFSNPKRNLWTELDVFEYSTSNTKRFLPKKGQNTHYRQVFATNCHIHRHPDRRLVKYNSPKWYDLRFDLSSKRIKVGFNWQEDKIQWYFNGVLVREEENKHFHQALHLQLDSETFPSWFGVPDHGPGNNNLPNHFRIMYVRSWYLEDEEDDESEESDQIEVMKKIDTSNEEDDSCGSFFSLA